MKPRTSLLASLVGASLLMSGYVLAQSQSMPQDAAQQPSAATQNSTMRAPAAAPPSATPPGGTGNSATYNSTEGQLTVNSTQGQTPSTRSPPSFEQLSGGSTYITKAQANAFPPLANDFIYVSGHSDRISKSQYEHWLQNLN